VLTSGQFTKTIYGFYQVPPAILADKVVTRIQNAVMTLLDDERRLYEVTSKDTR
jgi:hypothetical protein